MSKKRKRKRRILNYMRRVKLASLSFSVGRLVYIKILRLGELVLSELLPELNNLPALDWKRWKSIM